MEDAQDQAAQEQPAVEPDAQADAVAVEDGTDPKKDSIGAGWLLAAALALIAIPVLIGFIFLTGGDDTSSTGATSDSGSADGGMGGSDMGGDDATGVETGVPVGVGNFADIQASSIEISPDPSGDGAVLRVTTSVDVACGVAYGPTAELGSLATDTDMAGGGHTNHQPVMRNLVPGTTYFYRISAIGPDGRLYQSGLDQFVYTSDGSSAPEVQPPGPNVASFATVSDISSEFSADYSGRNAIDDDLTTEWSSAGDGDDAYIVLDFGEQMVVEGVGFRTRRMNDGTSITTSFSVTVDGTTYGPFESGPGLSVALVDFIGQVVRFDVETSTGGNTGALEVEVYGETDM